MALTVPRRRWRGRLFFPFALISSVWADYYIDDTNTTLTYSSGPKAAWGPFAAGGASLELLLPNGTYQVIDAFVCYNHTYRYAACFDTDSCLLTIPFTGSGITIYVYQAGPVGINASIIVDGVHTQTNVLNAPPAPTYEIANVSMFDVQRLPSSTHTLGLLVNDLFGSYSGMMFDYAYVNESFVVNATASTPTTTTTRSSASTTTSASASASASPSSSSSSHTDIAAIVGGVVGAAALIVVGVLAYFRLRRRRRRMHLPEMIDLHASSPSPPFNPSGRYDPAFPNVHGAYDPYSGYNPPTIATSGNAPTPFNSPSFTPLIPNRLGASDARATPSLPDSTRDTVTPFTATSSGSNASGTRSKTGLVVSNDTSAHAAPTSQSSPSDVRQDSERSPLLTDEQADFINSLHQNNVPAAAIARVMERMLADRHAGIREWERETRLARSNTFSTAPPSYDLVAEMG